MLEKIKTEKELTDEVSQALVDAVETFKKDFLPAVESPQETEARRAEIAEAKEEAAEQEAEAVS